MPFEIERKFLVYSDEYKQNSQSTKIKQVYLSIDKAMSIRIRIEGVNATLAIKSKVSERTNREYEYSIPMDEARSMIRIYDCPCIIKTRYITNYKGYLLEIDEFHEENNGLVVAEVELKYEDDAILFPSWIGNEVTHDYRYLNSNLALNPFNKWK